MPTFPIITSEILALATDAFDSILLPLSQGGLAKKCRLVYPPQIEMCENCHFDVIGQKSSNKYLHGGPMPFPMGSICPACGSKGTRSIEATEDIYFKTEMETKPFIDKASLEIKIPDGYISVKGYMTDMPKLQRAAYMLHDIELQPYLEQKFQIDGEITSPSNIVQGRYFEVRMKRVL